MRYAAITFGLASLGCGLVAAWYWYKASRIKFEPAFAELSEDVSETDFHWTLLRAIMFAVRKASALNRSAALWTAASVVLGGVGGLLNALAVR
jgi:hypothetical protein